MSKTKKPMQLSRKKQAVLKKAAKHFAPVLETMLDEPVFLLAKDDPNLVHGALTTSVLPLSGFIELFGDLIEEGNYSFAVYKKRNEDREFHIPLSAFDTWKEAGCLDE